MAGNEAKKSENWVRRIFPRSKGDCGFLGSSYPHNDGVTMVSRVLASAVDGIIDNAKNPFEQLQDLARMYEILKFRMVGSLQKSLERLVNETKSDELLL